MASDGVEHATMGLYYAYITRTVANERASLDRLDKRGDTIVSTSGALVTLVAAAAALVPKPKDFEVPALVVVLLMISLGMFLVTITMAQWDWIRPPPNEGVVPVEGLESVVLDFTEFRDDPDELVAGLARADLLSLVHLRRATSGRMSHVRWAGVAQMLAVGLLIAAASALLLHLR